MFNQDLNITSNKPVSKMAQLRLLGAIPLLSILALSNGCQKNDIITDPMLTTDPFDMRLHYSDFTKVNLVSDAAAYTPVYTDENLVNAWGLAFSDEGEAWVSSADMGRSTIYDANGTTLMAPVGIPFGEDPVGASPTGIIYNTTATFIIPATGMKAEFIFATENGTIAAWNSGPAAVMVADRSASGAIYKGLTYAKTMAGNKYIYATDFHNGRIDAFDQNFVYQPTMQFVDPTMPPGFAPFNIHAIDGLLYVTYAKQLGPENADDEAGPGNGYVDVFQPNGTFVMRFASNGSLNSPWGIEQTIGMQGAILIGNFGDGRISVFTSAGVFKSYLRKGDGTPVEIEGLWSIVFPRGNLAGPENDRLYFTAGPDDESHGIFGFLNPAE